MTVGMPSDGHHYAEQHISGCVCYWRGKRRYYLFCNEQLLGKTQPFAYLLASAKYISSGGKRSEPHTSVNCWFSQTSYDPFSEWNWEKWIGGICCLSTSWIPSSYHVQLRSNYLNASVSLKHQWEVVNFLKSTHNILRCSCSNYVSNKCLLHKIWYFSETQGCFLCISE